MTPVHCFTKKTVALFGLGGSGLATALALKAGGASVIACDDDQKRMEHARDQGIKTADLRIADWSAFSALILSPGVPLTHPKPHWSVNLARAAGIEIVGDIELFCREQAVRAPAAPTIAITGTNGKSTTTALIAHILRQAGFDVQMGGNIGTAILSLAPPAADRVHVIECSSFQIDLAPSLAPTVGVILNLTPDHLDRHGTMEHYAAIKERLVAKAGLAAIGLDDDLTRAIFMRRRGKKIGFSARGGQPVEGGMVFVDDERILWRRSPETLSALAIVPREGSLRGRHNAQNAAAAVAALEPFAIAKDVLQRALDSFPGLPHRMEEVGRLGQALFINDSKATNADSTRTALEAFEKVHWILGGRPKEGGVTSLAPLFGKIEKAYLIGEASDAFAKTLDGHVPYVKAGTLENAVAFAVADAKTSPTPEPVILLSPACASYDQFPNFEIRGDRFRDIVKSLPGYSAVKGS